MFLQFHSLEMERKFASEDQQPATHGLEDHMPSDFLKVKGQSEMQKLDHDQRAWLLWKAVRLPPKVATTSDRTALKHIKDSV